MSQPAQTPSDIAKEVFRRLAQSRVPPTPENFSSLYHQIAGSTAESPFPERELRSFAAALPRETPEQLRIARRVEGALSDRSWATFHDRLGSLLSEAAQAQPSWSGVIRELFVQMERRQSGLSQARKQEALEHVLSASQADSSQLYQRLQGLLRGWSGQGEADPLALLDEPANDVAPARPADFAPAPPQATPSAAITGVADLRALLAQILEDAIGGLLIHAPELSDTAQILASELRAPLAQFDLVGFTERLRGFAYKVEWVVHDQTGIRQALLKLLQLIIENIGELAIDDGWFSGQIAGVLQASGGPLNRDTLDELGKRLRDVILKQGLLKKSLENAQDRLKALLAGFVDHLSGFYDVTGEYRDRMERCADKVQQATSITDLSSVIEDVLRETRNIQLRAETSRNDLARMRTDVTQANAEIERLRNELNAASALVSHDPLTGTLNRKGLEDAMERELGRAERNGRPLCLALIDVDNFKQLNDALGHQAGDSALQHLAQVIGDTIRPQDAVARYGGEEFVVVLPDTVLDDAISVIQRLQRELTKRFFLHDKRKLLITFSAGVAQRQHQEPAQRTLNRADEAMYRAKRAGKNRVEAATQA